MGGVEARIGTLCDMDALGVSGFCDDALAETASEGIRRNHVDASFRPALIELD